MAKKSLILTADIKDFNMCFLELVDDNIVVNEKERVYTSDTTELNRTNPG